MFVAEDFTAERKRSRASSLIPEIDNHSRPSSCSRTLYGEKLPLDRKRSMSLASCLFFSMGSFEGLYSPNDQKSKSRVDLLRQESCNNFDLYSNSSNAKRFRKPRSNSVGPEANLEHLKVMENKSNSSLCLIDLNCEI